MSNQSSAMVQKLWNYCNVLRDDDVSYSDYVEQLTYLIFLKIADEQAQLPPPLGKPSTIPKEYDWQTLRTKDGDALEIHYRHTLENLGKQKGLSVIFRKSQSKIQHPVTLKRLIQLIDSETWIEFDTKGEIYEGLLQKNAEDIKGGAGQYFTPRPLITAITEAIKPQPGQSICDPACGTGGFLVAANNFIKNNYESNREQKDLIKNNSFKGFDIADGVARLCYMNLYLHGITGDESSVEVTDSLTADSRESFDIILSNLPFGKHNRITTFKDDVSKRDDFWATTSNKQLNFLQHVKTFLAINGKAAVVIPDNVLFEGGAGETIRKKLLQECDVHTLLRLPTGIFSAQGVKANVLFFDRKPPSAEPWTKKLWVYDLRTNQNFTLKRNPLHYKNLQDFIQCFNTKNLQERRETKLFRSFTYEELIERDKVNLDIIWVQNDSLEDCNVFAPETNSLRIEELILLNQDKITQVFDSFNLFTQPQFVVEKCIYKIREELKKALKNIIDASDSKTKGSSLEDFTQMLFGSLDYCDFYKRNLRNATSEIDIIFTVNKIPATLFAEFSDLLIVECKNWNEPVGAKEIRIFSTKMDELDSKVGIIISSNGITGDKHYIKDARGAIRNIWLQSRKIILFFDLEDLKSIVNGTCNLYKILYQKYYAVKTMSDY
ncbi:MAG: N-6 DNA methylase [Cyanobacteria bacterium J06633_8]